MYGAILGDIIGSPYEFDNGDKTKEFELFSEESEFTDDSVMTVAVCEALLESGKGAQAIAIKEQVISSMQKWGRKYPSAGYGSNFGYWLIQKNPQPYGSYGNGSAMRVSAVGWLYDTISRVRNVARATAEVSHNHVEGIKGAESVASAIFLARTGKSKEEIKEYIVKNFGYNLDRTCDQIRPHYYHVESCQKTVPEAMIAFLEGNDFEDVIRNAVSLGGDCDTLSAIAGSIAEAYYGVPEALCEKAREYLPEEMLKVIDRFDECLAQKKAEKEKLQNLKDSVHENHIFCEIGNIVDMDCTCIVNAANRSLLGGGGVDGAIHRAAGPELLEECKGLNGCGFGEAKITKGYNLKAQYIIHTVGPIYSGHPMDEKQLHDCYYNSLELAKDYDIHSIAFPAISTGAYGYPLKEAAIIALTAVNEWLNENPDYGMSVIMTCFDSEAYNVYQEALYELKLN